MVSSVRLPSDVIDLIQERIDSKEYRTKADFIIHAIRHTLHHYTNELKMAAEGKIDQGISEGEVNELYRGITCAYLQKYEKFSGEAVQIKFIAPEGLMNRVSSLLLMAYGFKKRSDFIKVAVMCLLVSIDTEEQIATDATGYIRKQKEGFEQVRQAIIESLTYSSNPAKIMEQFRIKMGLDTSGSK